MANIFELTTQWKNIVDMADELDVQTLEDTLEAIEEPIEIKVANMIAVIKNVEKEVELAKEFKKSVEDKIKTMNNTVDRLKEYILLGVDTVGKPKKGAEQFKKLEIKGAPWVKSAWTQNNPPSVQIVDDRLLDAEFLIPQPSKPDTKAIAARWKAQQEEYEAKRAAYLMSLQVEIDEGQISEVLADEKFANWEAANNPEIPGVNVIQTVGVRFR